MSWPSKIKGLCKVVWLISTFCILMKQIVLFVWTSFWKVVSQVNKEFWTIQSVYTLSSEGQRKKLKMKEFDISTHVSAWEVNRNLEKKKFFYMN